MYMERKKKTDLEETVRLIGIGGVSPGVGCTHFAVMLLNYLAGYQRRKAVLLEWNDSGDFEKLERVCTGKVREGTWFRVLDGDFYKAADAALLAGVLQSNYQDILIDFGVLEKQRFPDFLRCEKQFVLGSFSEWQEEAFRDFVRRNHTGRNSWRYLASFGSEETRKEFMRRPGILVQRIPFSADAFSVTKECAHFFGTLMETPTNG